MISPYYYDCELKKPILEISNAPFKWHCQISSIGTPSENFVSIFISL